MPATDSPALSDRRRHRRRPCRLSATAGGAPVRAIDLSAGGAFIERLDDGALAIGDRLPIELALPDGPLCVEGRVVAVRDGVWCAGGSVRFGALTDAARARLAAVADAAPRRAGGQMLARIALARRPGGESCAGAQEQM